MPLTRPSWAKNLIWDHCLSWPIVWRSQARKTQLQTMNNVWSWVTEPGPSIWLRFCCPFEWADCVLHLLQLCQVPRLTGIWRHQPMPDDAKLVWGTHIIRVHAPEKIPGSENLSGPAACSKSFVSIPVSDNIFIWWRRLNAFGFFLRAPCPVMPEWHQQKAASLKDGKHSESTSLCSAHRGCSKPCWRCCQLEWQQHGW